MNDLHPQDWLTDDEVEALWQKREMQHKPRLNWRKAAVWLAFPAFWAAVAWAAWRVTQ